MGSFRQYLTFESTRQLNFILHQQTAQRMSWGAGKYLVSAKPKSCLPKRSTISELGGRIRLVNFTPWQLQGIPLAISLFRLACNSKLKPEDKYLQIWIALVLTHLDALGWNWTLWISLLWLLWAWELCSRTCRWTCVVHRPINGASVCCVGLRIGPSRRNNN